jgi:glyoxylase-like metal-dependent hydrolase (beta-lactamase superfamily II)
MLTTVRIGGIEVVSLLDGVEDLDDPDILDPRHGPSDPVWEPSRARYPAVFAADGGWRLYVRATLLRAHGQLLGSLAEAGTSPHDVDIDGDHEITQGVRARHLPGHTPGHQVVQVSDGGASLLLSGDAINHPAQLRQPELAGGPDDDPETAGRARRGLIAELVDSDRLLAPAHFAEPFGRLVSDGPAGQISWQPIG